MTDPDYRPVSLKSYVALIHAFMEAPQTDGRFSGTPEQQHALAVQMRSLFDAAPGKSPLYLKHDDTLGLAGDLVHAQPRWSIGQYSASLASLIDPDRI